MAREDHTKAERQRRYVAKLRRLAVEALGGAERCSHPECEMETVEFAHRRPTSLSGRGRGQAARYRDVARNPTAYVMLCRDHHRAFDRGEESPF